MGENNSSSIDVNKFQLKKGIGYSCVQAASVLNDLMITYLTFYATNSLFLTAMSIGMILTVSKLFDGFTDVIAGIIIDRTHSKLGKARPYVLAGMVAYIFLIVLFSTPDISDSGKMIWIFVAYNLDSSIFSTLFNVSKETLLRRNVVGESARAKVLSMTGLTMSIVGMAVAVILPAMIDRSGGGGWTLIAGTLGIVGIGLLLVAFFTMKEFTEEELLAMGVLGNKEVKSKVSIKEQLTVVAKNKFFLLYIVMYALYAIIMSFSSSTATFYFNTNIGNLTLLSIVSMTGIFAFPLFAVYPKIIEKFGSRKFAMGCCLIGFSGYMVRMIAGSNLVALCIGNFFAGFSSTAFTVCHPIFLIDCMDYSMLRTGIQVETFFSSFTNAIMKIFMGLSSLILGAILTAGRYDGTLAVQPASAHIAINFAYNIFPAILSVTLFVLFYFFKVSLENQKMRDSKNS